MAIVGRLDVDNKRLECRDVNYTDELVTFTGADTYPRGTIMARDNVTLKLVPYVEGGTTNDNGVAKMVLPADLTAAAAGDIATRVISRGVLYAEGVSILGGEPVTKLVFDQLRDYSLLLRDSQDNSKFDN